MPPAQQALLVALLASFAAAQHPRILTCIAGVHRCLGVKDAAQAASFGCQVYNTTDCKTGKTTLEPCGACTTPTRLQAACLGQPLRNHTGQDGTPVTFNWPVDMSSLKAEHFEWVFEGPNNTTTARPAGCAIPRGGPASEANEGQTIAIVGDSGGWTASNPAVALQIAGDLMLIAPNGTKVSAKGLRYEGQALNFSTGLRLLTATLEPFSLEGETTRNLPLLNKVYPNHCRVLFPETTHRIRLLFDGGCTLDGRRPITPDRVDLVEVRSAAGEALEAGAVLGLADLGTAPMPQSQCEKENWPTDGDNYLDVCLKLATTGDEEEEQVQPASVYLPCGKDTQIRAPKGTRYPCAPQEVAVTSY